MEREKEKNETEIAAHYERMSEQKLVELIMGGEVMPHEAEEQRAAGTERRLLPALLRYLLDLSSLLTAAPLRSERRRPHLCFVIIFALA